MRIFKKRVAVLLAALMLLSAFSMVAFADETATTPVVTATPGEATPTESTPEETQASPEETTAAPTEATEATEATTATPEETTAPTEPAEKVWTVAGNVPAFGGDWNPANMDNKLTQGEDGLFSITFANVAKGEYEFKVTNGTWDEAYGDGSENFYVRLTDDSDLTITFNAETKEITVSGKNVTTERPKVEVVAGYYVTGSAGLCGQDWFNKADPNTLMMRAEDGNYYKDFTNVAAGEYSFKVIYVNAQGKVTWHPGGMGNDTVITVEKDGSLVRVKYLAGIVDPEVEGADGQEAATAEIFADPSTAPELKPYVEPATEPTTEATEPTTAEPTTAATEPTTVAPTTEATEPTTVAPTTEATQPTTKAPAVELNKTSKKLKAGKTFTIKVTGTTAKATFKSSKTSVAKVSSKGKVTALQKGKATITVKVAGQTLTCKVTVSTNPKLKAVVGKKTKKFSAKKTYAVKKGKKIKFKVTGKAKAINNKYKVNKKGAVKVSGKTTITIKGKKKGTCKVTVTVNKVMKFVIKVKVK